MSIFYPDLSQYNSCTVQPGTVVVAAKATHGHHFIDPKFTTFRRQARAVGSFFMAYHWLNAGDAKSQASYCYAAVGSTPLMVDAEDIKGNTGYQRSLTVADIANFVSEYRRLGGVVHLLYLPHWYWQNNMGSPSLLSLKAMGLYLVSSNYRTYSDTGAGWNGYGDMEPVVWQYTSTFKYGGDDTVDFNAFRGTLAEFVDLVSGATPAPSHVTDGNKEVIIAKQSSTGQLYLCDGMTSRPISPDEAEGVRYLAGQGLCNLTLGKGIEWDETGVRLGWFEGAFGAVPQPSSVTDDQITEIATKVAAAVPGIEGSLIEAAVRNVLRSV